MDNNFSSDDPRDPSQSNFEGEEDSFVTDEEIQALNAERDVFGIDEEMQAEKILKEHLVPAIHSIGKLSRTASSETVRLNAAKYIIDRNLGKITEPTTEEEDNIRKILDDVVVQ